ncbi:DNA-directed RNA polymerases II, IV and V subunit 9A-like [Dioscorea cayenensis subsp. rotundata]|uniref:DNA-directed RNA polymerase subunit n=1 Tax=Dioscorea cayennensis subsp. rotundata TaxID=55577 RepID=A0AB40AP48_DIOCR|nr:DNA-directed RNA polymerases II, IV and V subunit 9A-like [Dioscorea cayenensis subsp. rotundata]
MRLMKFCRKCNNVLFPKEDLQNKVLLYACINCNYQEEAENHCVYMIKINQSLGKGSHGEKIAIADTTLPRTKNVTCSQCNYSEAVFFQEVAKGEDAVSMFFICCNPSCGYKWRD